MKYSFDTSALVGAWRRQYPLDIFPKWWELFEKSINYGFVRISEAVLMDLSKQDDDVYDWVRNHKQLIIPFDNEIQIEVKNILSLYPRLVENKKNRSGSDPFVIALAKLNNAAVITCEKPTNNLNKPKIPDVCRNEKIRCVDLLQFMRDMNWRFS